MPQPSEAALDDSRRPDSRVGERAGSWRTARLWLPVCVTADDEPAEAGVRIKTHPSLCQGWGQCHRWAPDLYPLDAAGHIDVHVLHVPASRARDAELGALACPDHVITVIRE